MLLLQRAGLKGLLAWKTYTVPSQSTTKGVVWTLHAVPMPTANVSQSSVPKTSVKPGQFTRMVNPLLDTRSLKHGRMGFSKKHTGSHQ